MKKLQYHLILILSLIFSGCATVTGPSVNKEEIRKVRSGLEVKALDFRLKEIKRINAIGYHLIEFIPSEDIKVKSRPFLGLFCIERSEVAERLFQNDADKGLFVAFVLEETPIEKAGILPGDIVVAINGKKAKSIEKVSRLIYQLEPGEDAVLSILRKGEPLEITMAVDRLPVDVSFTVVDEDMVNAAAGVKTIFVTYGLLNFAKSDDEIAAVLGHELAHLVRKHVRRKQGSYLVSAILAIGLGLTAEAYAPGAGEVVTRGVGGVGNIFGAHFSRDLEREADYFGVKFIYLAGYDPEVAATVHERFAIEIPGSMISNYLSSHPSSPERTLRIRKAIEEFQREEQDSTGEPVSLLDNESDLSIEPAMIE